MELRVIYDSKSLAEGLADGWGFACLVGNDLLFNSGRNGSQLLQNMEKLGVKPSTINAVVISNAEVDHSGGLFDLLKQNPMIKIYLHPRFPEGFIKNVREQWGDRLVLVRTFTELSPDIYATGPYPTREQLLVIRGKAGLIVLTGCAQPNPVDMLENVQKHLTEPIYLVIGGLHLSTRMEAEVLKLIDDFRRLGVKRVAPCHCTGQEAV